MRKQLYTSAIAMVLAVGMPMTAFATYNPGHDNNGNNGHGYGKHWKKWKKRDNWQHACKPQEWKVDIENETEVDVDNYNPQDAHSGDASVRGNTTGGDARSGNALNDSLLELDVSVDNSGSLAAALAGSGSHGGDNTIENTGPRSHNDIQGTGGGDNTIENTGPRSVNLICNGFDRDIRVENETEIDVDNDNRQYSRTGDASVRGNTTGGDARSGNARNVSTLDVSASVSAKPSSSYKPSSYSTHKSDSTIKKTGPRSVNVIQNGGSFDADIKNETKVEVNNNNEQNAHSGNATVRGNTTGGDAVSGDATNISTTKVTLKVNN